MDRPAKSEFHASISFNKKEIEAYHEQTSLIQWNAIRFNTMKKNLKQ